MKYLFILGRNPELSIFELKSALGEFNYKRIGNAILADLPKLQDKFIDKLGGTIAVGEVFDIDKLDLSKIPGTKINYVVWDFSDGNEFLDEAREELKQKFKEEGMKATEKKVANRMKMQSGREVPNLSSKKLIDEQYFVFDDKFGRIIQTNDYEELEKEDMEKPVRRESLAISPRLAKIMINLSRIKQGETLVDPFCGIGVILQEALKREFQVIGIDIDKEAVNGLKRNLQWFKFNDKNYKLIVGNSSQVKIVRANAIVTEPDLGKVVKSMPNEDEAKNIIRNYEALIVKVLNNLKNSVSGRFVFTAPLILCKSEGKVRRIGCNRGRILSTGLHFVSGFPIEEFRENQIVGREIFVLGH